MKPHYEIIIVGNNFAYKKKINLVSLKKKNIRQYFDDITKGKLMFKINKTLFYLF